MADRRVTQTQKNSEGDILGLCNPGETWSPRSKADAVRDIDNGLHTYYVNAAGHRTDIHVYAGKHLRTDPDPSSGNNLDNLPDC